MIAVAVSGGAVMDGPGTVAQVARDRWNIRLVLPEQRFREPGWSYEGQVPYPCPQCGAPLSTLRKHYQTWDGKPSRYTVTICPPCSKAFTLGDLNLKSHRQLLRPVQAPPTAPSSPNAVRSAEASRRAGILRFWRSVELFGAQVLERPDPGQNRFDVRLRDLVPWDPGHRLHRVQLPKDLVWRHTIYGGVFKIDQVHRTLEGVFGSSGPDLDERAPRGDGALFAINVTADGIVLLDSLVVSTAPWATGRAVRPGPASPTWLDGFAAAEQDLILAFRKVLDDAHEAYKLSEPDDASPEPAREPAEGDDKTTAEVPPVPQPRPVCPETVRILVDLVGEQLGVAELLGPAGFRVHSERVHRKNAEEAGTDFLNSFFLEDLDRIASAVEAGDCGTALAAYLTDDANLDTEGRCNVRDDTFRDRLLTLTAPVRTPAGRWPASARHPLATSQQLAINAMREQLGTAGGLFGVNGPPGTGKTTMLRDLVAALVVERAGRLAVLPSPDAAFDSEKPAWNTNQYRRRIRPLKPEFTGYEIVVASMNNGAIENVTKEIPQVKAVHDSWLPEAAYLPEQATRVLEAPAWGLIAARLGNKKHRTDFVKRFWWPAEGYESDTPAENAEDGFRQRLTEYFETTSITAWPKAVDAFKTAAAQERRCREERQAVADQLAQLKELDREFQTAEAQARAATEVRDQAVAQHAMAARQAVFEHQTAEAARSRRSDHYRRKPRTFEIIFTFGSTLRVWRAEDRQLAADEQRTAATAHHSAQFAENWHRAAAHAATNAAQTANRYSIAQRAVAQARAAVENAATHWPDTVPTDAWHKDEYQREVFGPWLDEQWNESRTRLFLAALNLHAAFVASTAAVMRDNLACAMDVLTGSTPPDAPAEAVLAAWQSLFLVVPVVSSTFASVARMFSGLRREALGWLLIDEAGQATPQAAVGAIWRARNVVAVGDPLQLEPVVTVLRSTQAVLRDHHRIADLWMPGSISVQALADRITPLGTHLPGPDDTPVWVGAPLRVHRRCDNPMFDVVNIAVYQNLMVHATPVRERPLTVRKTAWIDVAGGTPDGNWIPAEGKVLKRALDDLVGSGIEPPDILAITPFRRSAQGIRELLGNRYPGLTNGTVHTAQGKEAYIVILVLGGGTEGARLWAASKPNLFNVAVSRARQRLYVIGDYDKWSRLNYFSTLAHELKEPKPKTSG